MSPKYKRNDHVAMMNCIQQLCPVISTLIYSSVQLQSVRALFVCFFACFPKSWLGLGLASVVFAYFYTSEEELCYLFVSRSIRVLSVCFAWHNICVLSGELSTKLKLNIHVNGNCWKGFQGQRSKVKVIRVHICECCNGGCMHFDSVALRLGCVLLLQVCCQ